MHIVFTNLHFDMVFVYLIMQNLIWTRWYEQFIRDHNFDECCLAFSNFQQNNSTNVWNVVRFTLSQIDFPTKIHAHVRHR